jgi:hypothetical protein
MVERGRDWRGDVWLGEARVTDGGTEAAVSLPPSQGWTGPDTARHGGARHAPVRSGIARQGLQTAARSFYGGSLLLSLEGRQGRVWRGTLRLGALGRGTVWRCQARRGKG